MVPESSNNDNQSPFRLDNSQTNQNELKDLKNLQVTDSHFNVQEQSPPETVYEIVSQSPGTSKLPALIIYTPPSPLPWTKRPQNTPSSRSWIPPSTSSHQTPQVHSRTQIPAELTPNPVSFPASRMAYHPTMSTQLHPSAINGAARFGLNFDISPSGATFVLNMRHHRLRAWDWRRAAFLFAEECGLYLCALRVGMGTEVQELKDRLEGWLWLRCVIRSGVSHSLEMNDEFEDSLWEMVSSKKYSSYTYLYVKPICSCTKY